jgi:hypothetical protein
MRVAAIILAGLTVAQAEPNVLTLVCTGTATSPTLGTETISKRIIVDFATRTVQGFSSPGWNDYPVMIAAANDVKVEFKGSHEFAGQSVHAIEGSMDRVTGDVETRYKMSDAKTNRITAEWTYVLKCRPAHS